MSAMSGQAGLMAKQDGAHIALSNAACTDLGTHKEYQITDVAKRYLDPAATFVVEISTNAGETWATIVPEKIEYAGGIIRFTTANGASDLIRIASGYYFNMTTWGGFLNWKLEASIDMLDSTTFVEGGASYKTFVPGLREFSGSAEAYWQDNTNTNLLGSMIMFTLYVDAGTAKSRYECYGCLSKDSISNAVNALVKENLDFKVSFIYYREG